MKFRDMGIMWLRDRARELRTAASAAELAYRNEGPRTVCEYVAAKYRAAAVLLDDAATEAEDNPDFGVIVAGRTTGEGGTTDGE